jgi:hypothetical protein
VGPTDVIVTPPTVTTKGHLFSLCLVEIPDIVSIQMSHQQSSLNVGVLKEGSNSFLHKFFFHPCKPAFKAAFEAAGEEGINWLLAWWS